MGLAYWAAREKDILLHTSLLADIAGAAVEIACYAAITAAASLLIFGTPFTGGASGLALTVLVGVVMGASGGSSLVSEAADWVSGLFPPSEDGQIATGSKNTRTNSKRSARAAGTLDRSIGLVAAEKEPEQPKSFVDITKGILGGIWEVAKQTVRPTIASPDPRAVPKDEDKIICYKHPSSFSELGEKLSQPPGLAEILCPPLAGVDALMGVVSAGWGSLTGAAEYMAEGSKKVYINSQPAVRSNDRSTCEAKVTDDCTNRIKVSDNVRIGGEPIVVREIKSGKHPVALMVAVAMAVMRPGKICSKIACFAMDFVGDVGLGFLTAKLTEAVMRGNPVHLPTGGKLLGGVEELDFTVPAHFPIEWQRFYSSKDSRTQGMFGAGWSVMYEVEMEISPQEDGSCAAVYINEQGRRLEIEALYPGEGLRGVSENLTIKRGDDYRWVIESDDGIYRLFEPDASDPGRLRLTLMQDRNDNKLFLYRDTSGRIVEIADSQNAARIVLHYEDSRHPLRVTRIMRELAEGSHRLLARYSYSIQGDLEQVFDAENLLRREFAYDAGQRMVSHRLPTGMLCHYQWDCFIGPEGPEWRVIHHWSEGEGRQEDYIFHYDLTERVTVVQDSLGRVSKHYWNEFYQIIRYVDALGQTTLFSWSEEQQLLSVTDSRDGQWRYVYDDQGRLTEETDPLNRTSQTAWLPHWALPTLIRDAGGHTWRYFYDERGNLLTLVDPLKQRTLYQYDMHGQVVKTGDPRGNNNYLRWNENGQLTHYVDCSGSVTQLSYDELNNIAGVTNAVGDSSRYQYNAAGQLVAAILPDGRQERYTVNASGQLLAYRDPSGHTTRYRRDASGQVISRTDAAGRTLHFHHDAYGRLVALINENGERYQFRFDARDRLIEQSDLDGRKQQFVYDALDNVTAVRFAAGTADQVEHRFSRDAMGRLTEKQTTDGCTTYRYDKTDNLLEVAFRKANQPDDPPETIAFSYDRLGRLLTETTARGTLKHDHDGLGNLTRTTLPDGQELKYHYYGSGHLSQINLDSGTVCEFERDRLHREILRTQGRLDTRRHFDSAGRIHRVQTCRGRNGIVPDTVADRHYQYDNLDRLITRRHSRQGRTDYHYDATGRITRCHHAHYRDTLDYDAAANLLDGSAGASSQSAYHDDPPPGTLQGNVVRFNRLMHFRRHHYQYDAHGRMQGKRSPGQTLRCHYSAEHRLIKAEVTQGQHTRSYGYVYDALGRRVEKHELDSRGNTFNRTTFLWDGLRMVQETRPEGSRSLYLYAGPGSHEPLARADTVGGVRGNILYFHTDINGAPEELTDPDGNVVWEAHYQVWGNTVREVCAETEHTPVEQNLRYQGQYLDRETGLHYNTFRYYDPDGGRFTTPDPIGLRGGINLYQYAPNPLSWIDPLGLSGKGIFIHYTDKAGFERIMSTGIIEANSKGKVYITDILLSPQDAMRDIFINDPIHTGRGDYSIIFKADSTHMGNIFQSSELEYIHSGRLKLGEILHAGKNPYDVVSHLSYEKRLNMTQNQINSRGGKCG